MTTTERPAVRALPQDHDNPEAKLFVPPELRDDYVTLPWTEMLQLRLVQELERAQRQANQDRDLAIWERTRARIEQTRPPWRYAEWLRHHTRADGKTPNLKTVGTMDGAPMHFSNAVIPTWMSELAMHLVLMPAVRDAYDQRTRHTRMAADARRRSICAVCAAASDQELATRAGSRVCEPCAKVLDLVELLDGTVTDGRTRLQAVLDHANTDESQADATSVGRVWRNLLNRAGS